MFDAAIYGLANRRCQIDIDTGLLTARTEPVDVRGSSEKAPVERRHPRSNQFNLRPANSAAAAGRGICDMLWRHILGTEDTVEQPRLVRTKLIAR